MIKDKEFEVLEGEHLVAKVFTEPPRKFIPSLFIVEVVRGRLSKVFAEDFISMYLNLRNTLVCSQT
jgi:hypothetical protein